MRLSTLVALALLSLSGCARHASKPANSTQAASKPPRQEDAKTAKAPAAAAESDTLRYRVSPAQAPWRGAKEPLVTIVQFSDFECPFCSDAGQTLERLVTEHPQDVRIVFRNHPMPFHRFAFSAAEAALEARAQKGDEAFWRMHDLLFAHQQALAPKDLEGYARELGLDVSRFRRALQDRSHRATIESDIQTAQALRATGTPWHFINGRSMPGAQPYELFAEVVQEELKVAKEMIARGVERSAVYAALTAKGKTQIVGDVP